MRCKQIWEFAQSCLDRSIPVAVLSVVEHTVGSPGKKGFRMAVDRDGNSVGTIGGGVMEFNLVRRACLFLASASTATQLIPLVHRPSERDASGLICSGSQTVVLHPLYPKQTKLPQWILQQVDERGSAMVVWSARGCQMVEGTSVRTDSFTLCTDGPWIHAELIGPEMLVTIVGGGHVGLALSRIMATLDAHITVFDHRSDLPQICENRFAHRIVLGPYENLRASTCLGERAYAVVVSTSFATDAAALLQLLPLPLRYLGVMGSGAKLKRLRAELLSAGFSPSDWSRIHAPIGIDIHSHSAEEIAISIAAEIIREKNSNGPQKLTDLK